MERGQVTPCFSRGAPCGTGGAALGNAGDAEWKVEKLDQMLQDLREIGEGISRMRQRFRSFTQGYKERIN